VLRAVEGVAVRNDNRASTVQSASSVQVLSSWEVWKTQSSAASAAPEDARSSSKATGHARYIRYRMEGVAAAVNKNSRLG